jgi:hypothetical protein
VRLRVWLLAFAAFAALGTTWALASPILSNPDEPAHSVKAAATVRGQLVPPKEPLPDLGPGQLLQGGWVTSVTVPYSYSWQTSELPLCYIYDHRAPAGCAPPFVDGPELARWVTFVGRFPPLYYVAVGWPTGIDTGVQGFFAMRFLSVALNAALLASALACAVASRRLRFLAVGVLVAATPQAVLLGAAINPNGMEANAAILTWVAGTVALLYDEERLPRGVLPALAAGAVTLAWSRSLATLWLAVIGVTLLLAFGDRARLATRLRGRRERLVIAVVGLASVGAAAWVLLTDSLDNNSGYEPRGLGFWAATRHSLELTPSYLRQMVAVFGWQREPSPAWLSWLWGASALVLVIAALWPRRQGDQRRARLVLVGFTVLNLLLPTIMQAPTAERFGFVWSGRYGLALGAGVPVLAAAIIARRDLAPAVTRALTAVIVVAIGFGHIVAHWANMRRYVVGLEGPAWYLGHDGWDPPIVSSAVLLVMVVAIVSGLAIFCYRLVAAPTPETAATSP